jgi:nitroimidazol reductase NimA-like FMN-containing flavoprotein (pyridoxamine 5'-phosphate oxidase superfamily)
MREPQASRPEMAEYGILEATAGQGLLPWSWAVAHLRAATTYWLSTVRPDGQPHLVPVWGLWLEEGFYFSTGSQSRKARNLVVNPACVVSLQRGDESVIVEGQAAILRAGAVWDQVDRAYQAKYQQPLPPDSPVFAVQPTRVFGFTEAAEAFVATATRWTWPPSETDSHAGVSS